MACSVPAGRLRRTFGRERWAAPEPYGEDGWLMRRKDGRASVIVSVSRIWGDGIQWVHASIATSRDLAVPSYLSLVTLHKAVWGDEGYAFQAFVPGTEHISIHPNALHLWGRLDGARPDGIPDFGQYGSI
jgi:hypothetical protein